MQVASHKPLLRRALITGASGGIGRAVARALAGGGWHLVLLGRKKEALQKLREELPPSCEVQLFPCDLKELEEVRSPLERFLKDHPCTGFVHAAGSTRDGLLLRYPLEALEELLTVHLKAAFLLSQLVLPAMLREEFGRIVYVGSTAALAGNAGQCAYAAAKMGLIGLARSLTREVGKRGITINVVAPGWIETEMTAPLLARNREAVLETIPARRLGSAEEVGAAIAYLFTSEAGYVCGQTLLLNGGLWMI